MCPPTWKLLLDEISPSTNNVSDIVTAAQKSLEPTPPIIALDGIESAGILAEP